MGLKARFGEEKKVTLDTLIENGKRRRRRSHRFFKNHSGQYIEILKKGLYLLEHYGEAGIDYMRYDESEEFKHNFRHKYSISIVIKEKNGAMYQEEMDICSR